MSNFQDTRFLPIRRALRRLFYDGVPDWVITMVNDLPSGLTDEAIKAIADAIEALAISLGEHIQITWEQLKTVLTMNGAIGPGGGTKPSLKPVFKRKIK